MRTVVSFLAAALCSGTAGADPLPRFPSSAVWNQNIATATAHPQSAAMISRLNTLGGFGFGRFQIDFSIRVVQAPPGSGTATIAALPSSAPEDRYYAPDCEPIGSTVPIPGGATIEGSADMSCDVFGNDCHYLVVDGNTLYDVYRANLSGNTLQAQCLATWRLDLVYPPEGRGEHCTSADAAGFAIAPLLFNADEIAASLASDPTGNGDIGHAIRFILPNARMASDVSLG